jgi:hypothetical protein
MGPVRASSSAGQGTGGLRRRRDVAGAGVVLGGERAGKPRPDVASANVEVQVRVLSCGVLVGTLVVAWEDG